MSRKEILTTAPHGELHQNPEIREIYRQEYRDLLDAFRSLRHFIEKLYNENRLHSALGYRPADRVRV